METLKTLKKATPLNDSEGKKGESELQNQIDYIKLRISLCKQDLTYWASALKECTKKNNPK